MKKGIKLPFAQAKDNFHQASRYGLDSHIIWLDGQKHRLQSLLRTELIPRAILGLKSFGISTCDAEVFLSIILDRINNKQNGCAWQRQYIEIQSQDINLSEKLKSMTQAYLKYQQSAKPVSGA